LSGERAASPPKDDFPSGMFVSKGKDLKYYWDSYGSPYRPKHKIRWNGYIMGDSPLMDKIYPTYAG